MLSWMGGFNQIAFTQEITHLRLQSTGILSLDMNEATRVLHCLVTILSKSSTLRHLSLASLNLREFFRRHPLNVWSIFLRQLQVLVLDKCHLGSWEGTMGDLVSCLEDHSWFSPLQALWVEVSDLSDLDSDTQHCVSPDRSIASTSKASLESLHLACRQRGIDPYNPVPWTWTDKDLGLGALIPPSAEFRRNEQQREGCVAFGDS